MTTGSMSPTLQGTNYENGDRILMEKVTSLFRKPRRWEIYFFYEPDGTPVAKRIAGMPGEKIAVKDHRIYINGLQLEQPKTLQFIKYYSLGNLTGGKEVDCGQGYFLLGDDSSDSYDSRFIGPVKLESFRGRAWFIVSPASRMGFIK